MPMFLFRGNVHDVAWDDDLLLRFCGNDALARGHEQHLIYYECAFCYAHQG